MKIVTHIPYSYQRLKGGVVSIQMNFVEEILSV